MDIKSYEEEYDYLEQMTAIYKQKQKQIRKKLNKIESNRELAGQIKVFLIANLIVFWLKRDIIKYIDFKDLATVEVVGLIISKIGWEGINKIFNLNYEDEDLEQLAQDLYNYHEKEKGCYAQIKQCNNKYFEENTFERAKIYSKGH